MTLDLLRALHHRHRVYRIEGDAERLVDFVNKRSHTVHILNDFILIIFLLIHFEPEKLHNFRL